MLRRHCFRLFAVGCLAAALTAATSEPARAIGYYNLPGSFCQCFGYGNGAGHHACLVLGPSTCEGFCATKEVRLEYPPQPPYGYYGSGPCNSMTHGTWLNDGTQLNDATQLNDGSQPQPPAPEPTPAPSAMRPQVHRRPVVW